MPDYEKIRNSCISPAMKILGLRWDDNVPEKMAVEYHLLMDSLTLLKYRESEAQAAQTRLVEAQIELKKITDIAVEKMKKIVIAKLKEDDNE